MELTYRCYFGAVIGWEIPSNLAVNLKNGSEFEEIQPLARNYAVWVQFVYYPGSPLDLLQSHISYTAQWRNLTKIHIEMAEICHTGGVLSALAVNAPRVQTLDLTDSANGDWSALSQFGQLRHLVMNHIQPPLTDNQIIKLGELQLQTLELRSQNFGNRDVSMFRALRANYVDLSYNNFNFATAHAAVESLQPSARILLNESYDEELYWELQYIIAMRDNLVDWLESQLALLLASHRRGTRIPRELHEYIVTFR